MRILSFVIICILFLSNGYAQRKRKNAPTSSNIISYPDSLYNAMEWRNIGPFRGGRSTTSSGVVGQPLVYYFGSVGGGVWKTEDAGIHWKNISDSFFNATSIGAIAVAESDPNVIYVGTGEACVRGVMTSHGDGVYKSTDSGATWTHIGLDKTMHISEIRIHPDNPDIVYVAAQGSAYVPTPDRGVYRSRDGGKNWDKVHFVDNSSGVSSLAMDMNNPRILYAGYWDTQRLPWYIRSGGPGSGIWKSKDSGDTWEKLEEGLPESVMGKIGLTVSRANPNRLYAIIESDEGGLFRSDDGGKKWKKINSKRILRTRSWYYMHVFADPVNEDVVYVLNAPFMKSIDGGKTFNPVAVPHGDNHDLWINPENPGNLINSNDGGANVSFNGGKSWSSQRNQPTAQFYRLNADNVFPYRLYAGQQDNSTVAIKSRTDGFGIGWQDWIAGIGGGESAHVAFDPEHPKYVYATSITGFIDEYNMETGKKNAIKPYPVFDLGEPSDEMKYRYNWNPPVMTSMHDPSIIYFGSNVIHKTTNRARKWEEISPDLTRNDTTHLGLMGGPITNEAAGGEIYHTLMTLAESPHDPDILWAGADDGYVHITKDKGANWSNVSPGIEGIINSIEVSPRTPGTVYITVMRYKFNDLKPYIFRTINNGQSWKQVNTGIPDGAYARVVREDPDRSGLLYAGTERGMYISFDAGASWKPFQQNLPMVPITDLKVHQQDLLAATHGRAFWILDDLTPLHQLGPEVERSKLFVFKPRDVIATNNSPNPKVTNRGTNPYPGASIKYYINNIVEEDSTELRVEISGTSGNILRNFSTEDDSKTGKIEIKKGMNILKWDLRVDPIKVAEGVMPASDGELAGYHALPGTYAVKFTWGDVSFEKQLSVLKDPRDDASAEDYQAKEVIVKDIYGDLNSLYESLKKLQQVREQVETMKERVGDEDIDEMGEQIMKEVGKVEKELISPKQKTFQDIINFRNKLDGQLFNLMQTIDDNTPPLTDGERTFYQELQEQWNGLQKSVDKILLEDVKDFNNLLREKGVEYIAPKKKKEDKQKEPDS